MLTSSNVPPISVDTSSSSFGIIEQAAVSITVASPNVCDAFVNKQAHLTATNRTHFRVYRRAYRKKFFEVLSMKLLIQICCFPFQGIGGFTYLHDKYVSQVSHSRNSSLKKKSWCYLRKTKDQKKLHLHAASINVNLTNGVTYLAKNAADKKRVFRMC